VKGRGRKTGSVDGDIQVKYLLHDQEREENGRRVKRRCHLTTFEGGGKGGKRHPKQLKETKREEEGGDSTAKNN